MHIRLKATKSEITAIAKFAELFSNETVEQSEIDEMFNTTEVLEENLKNIKTAQKATGDAIEASLFINADLMAKIIDKCAEILGKSAAFTVLTKIYTDMCEEATDELMANAEIQELLEKFKEPEEPKTV